MKPWAFGINETALEYPHWQRPVLEALRNKDSATKSRLKELVSAAQTAILARQKRMSAHKRHATERRAMEDAMVVLCILERTYLTPGSLAKPPIEDAVLAGTSLVQAHSHSSGGSQRS